MEVEEIKQAMTETAGALTDPSQIKDGLGLGTSFWETIEMELFRY